VFDDRVAFKKAFEMLNTAGCKYWTMDTEFDSSLL